MSYILEALKRAERERRAGSSSSLLDEVPNASNPSALPGWQRWLVPAAISALAAAIVTYLLVGHGAQPPARTSAATPTAPPAAVPQAAPLQSAENRNIVAAPLRAAPAQETATPSIEDDGHISSLKDLDDKPAPAATAAARTDEGDDNAPAVRAASARGTSRADNQTAASDDDGDGPRAIVSQKSAATASVDAAPQKPAATENLREMPEDFRANFPAITVDVHAYAEDAAKRFVLIGGNRYHENDTLPQGPKIFAIVPEGIVFEWQGQRVLYALAGR